MLSSAIGQYKRFALRSDPFRWSHSSIEQILRRHWRQTSSLPVATLLDEFTTVCQSQGPKPSHDITDKQGKKERQESHCFLCKTSEQHATVFTSVSIDESYTRLTLLHGRDRTTGAFQDYSSPPFEWPHDTGRLPYASSRCYSTNRISQVACQLARNEKCAKPGYGPSSWGKMRTCCFFCLTTCDLQSR